MRVSRRPRFTVATVAAAIAVPLVVATLPATAGGASPTTALPSVRLIGTQDHLAVTQPKNGGLYLDPNVYVASVGGAFELWAQRTSYRDPLVVSQVVRQRDGDVKQTQPLPEISIEALNRGLPDFLRLTFSRKGGEVIRDQKLAFCPNGYNSQRVDDTGPQTPTYPQVCYANPFTLGMVWGIDKGWATQFRHSLHFRQLLPEGKYQLTYTMTRLYREQFDVAAADASVTMHIDIVTRTKADSREGSAVSAGKTSQQATLSPARNKVPGAGARPDVAALPAWGISVDNRKRNGHSYIRFGATVWNRGPSPLVVEGFREENADTMKAYQYFYRDGELVGKALTGRLEYDDQDGHEHWHFRDFANYSLLDDQKTQVLRSGKEAFCLAPTDIIDLTVAGAAMRPWLEGLNTACGEADSLWIREVLQTGWGDTYAQYRPGQSFDITDLPNGKYFIEVRANPDGRLYEVTADNNVTLRKVYIRGTVNDRRVVVPPYQGIDSEGGSLCSFFC